MDELMEILEGLRPDVDFESETALITDGILDSFDVVALVSEFIETFGAELDVDDIVPENFNSVNAMVKLLEEKSA